MGATHTTDSDHEAEPSLISACTYRKGPHLQPVVLDDYWHEPIRSSAASSSSAPRGILQQSIQELACVRRCGPPLEVADVRRRLARMKTRRQRSTLLQLPKDVALRIALEVASNSADLHDICALSVACPELWLQLQDTEHPLWLCRLYTLLGAGRFNGDSPPSFELGQNGFDLDHGTDRLGPAAALRSPQSTPSEAISARQWCLWLLAADRLLHSALTSCDWLSLSDAGEVLAVAGLRHPSAFALAILALVASQEHPPAPQALHWLWELATGRARPWSEEMKPSPEAVRVDSLRRWLHSNVSASIVPWHERDDQAAFDELFHPALQDKFAKTVAYIAASALLAVECVVPHPGPCSIFTLPDYAACVEGALDDATTHRLWPLMLLLLARAYKAFAELSRDMPPEAQRSHGNAGPSVPAADAWCGLAFAWHPGNPATSNLPCWVETLRFPALFYDQHWLHSQHGTLCPQGVANAFTESRTAQLDAKFNSQADCFNGHWMEHQSFKQLAARVFMIEPRYGGLKRWMAATTSSTQACYQFAALSSSDNSAHTTQGGACDGVQRRSELFGIIGNKQDDVLRCFHLSPPARLVPAAIVPGSP